MAISPRLSFKGYRLSTALARNKEYFKALILLITGYNYMTGFDFLTFCYSIMGAVIVLVGKLLMDAYDFYFTEVDIPEVVPAVVTAK